VVRVIKKSKEMHLGVVLAQVKNGSRRYLHQGRKFCEQKWNHVVERLLNKETYLKDAFLYVSNQ